MLGINNIVLETHFGFGFPNGSPVGDSLSMLGINNYLKPNSPGHRICVIEIS